MNKFLIKEEIIDKLPILFKNNYDKNCVKEIMYDLRLGINNFITPNKQVKQLSEQEVFIIESGQYALLSTKEYLNLPNNIFGLITIKMKYKSQGLINISGFHVDPGFEGHLIFSVFNVGPSPIPLRRDEEVFSIMFYELEKEVIPKKRQIDKIPLEMIQPLVGGQTPSIIELKNLIDENTMQLKNLIDKNSMWLKILTTICTTLICGIILYLITKPMG